MPANQPMTPEDVQQQTAEMKFLGIEDKDATFHYAYMSGSVKYHQPGLEDYYIDVGTFLKLREEGKIVLLRKHDNYDPVTGGKSQVYGYAKK